MDKDKLSLPKDGQLGSIFIAVTITALTVLMTVSYATTGYVDREIEKVENRHSKEIVEIKRMISTMNNRVFEMWKKIPQ